MDYALSSPHESSCTSRYTCVALPGLWRGHHDRGLDTNAGRLLLSSYGACGALGTDGRALYYGVPTTAAAVKMVCRLVACQTGSRPQQGYHRGGHSRMFGESAVCLLGGSLDGDATD